MNATLCMTTDVALDVCNNSRVEDNYATSPMVAVLPQPEPIDEEALHTLFEQAISDRLIALHSPWSQLNSQASSAPLKQLETDPIARVQSPITTEPLAHESRWSALPVQNWQRNVIYVCMALMFMMLGFDLMGLLVLHIH